MTMSEPHPLEEALKQASANPEAREAFYKAVLSATVHVVGRAEPAEDEEHQGHIQLKQWQQPDGTMALPFFASEESLKGALGNEEPHLTIPVLDLFQLTRGTTLVFTTPDGGKAFQPDEVETLLASVFALDPLARALSLAARENTDEARNAFYQTLVNSEVYVLGKPNDDNRKPTNESRNMNESDQFFISSCPHPHLEGQLVVPFFSSLEHLKRFVKEDTTYLTFQALTFFELTRPLEKELVLNLGFEVTKFFKPSEVEMLMNSVSATPPAEGRAGMTGGPEFVPRKIDPDTQIVLGPPKDYPQDLIRALLDFLPEHREVKAAYLTTMRTEGENSDPVLVIGFDAEGDLAGLCRAAEPLVVANVGEDQVVDFAKIVPGEPGLSQYLLEQTSPFYLRPIIRGEKAGGNGLEDAHKTGGEEKIVSQPGLFDRLKRIFGGSK